MKKLLRNVLCVAAMALMLSAGASAAGPGDLSIEFNGQPLTFTDAAPQIVSDRTYLPFRAVFTALGFADENITFAGDTRTVSAVREDLAVSMVIGENRVTIVEDGQKRVLDTDVPAFIDPAVSRTYVPVSFVAQAVGYRVAWDGETRTVLIDDVEGVLAANTGTYKILDKYLDYSRNFQKKNYKVQGEFSYSVEVLGEKMGMDGSYSMVTAGNTLYDSEVKMNLSGMMDGTDLDAAVPEEISMYVRGDMTTGVMYYKADTLVSTAEGEQENVWFKTQKDGLNAGTGMTYADMVNLSPELLKNMDGKAVIEARIRSEMEADPTVSVVDYLEIYNAMLSDSSFAKDGSDYVNAVKVGGVSMSVRFHTAANQVTGYTITMGAEENGMSMTMETSMKKDRMTTFYELVDAFTSSRMEMDGVYTSTRQKPAGVPDKDAVVLDVSEATQQNIP